MKFYREAKFPALKLTATHRGISSDMTSCRRVSYAKPLRAGMLSATNKKGLGITKTLPRWRSVSFIASPCPVLGVSTVNVSHDLEEALKSFKAWVFLAIESKFENGLMGRGYMVV
jgi:hypothetical protein